MEDKSLQQGAVITFAAYLLWGIFPIYWKFLEHVPAGEVLAHRIVWSLIFMIFLVLVTGNWRELIETVHELKKIRRKPSLSLQLLSLYLSTGFYLFFRYSMGMSCRPA